MQKFLEFLYSPGFVEILLFGAIFGAVLLLVLNFFPDEKLAIAKKRLGVAEDSVKPVRTALLRWFHRFYAPIVPLLYSNRLPAWLAGYFESRRKPLHRKLITANIRDEITPDEFFGFKAVMSFVIFLMLIYLSGTFNRPVPWPLWPLLFAAGWYFPDLWLLEMIKARRRAITRVLPYTLDLLTLSVEAGLDFIAAIQRLTQRSKENPLLTEFGHMLKEIRLGTSRSDALRNLSDRLNIEEITSFSTLLIQADQLGASIGQVLRAQADQLRTKRFQAAETAGAKASQLVLFPLVLCIFPAIFIVVLGPSLLNFLRGGLF